MPLRLVSVDRTGSNYLKRFVTSEIAKWAVPVKASGVSVDSKPLRRFEGFTMICPDARHADKTLYMKVNKTGGGRHQKKTQSTRD
jgi:hypothetical protein